ncbi:MAG: hypothetical protein SGI92_17990 [Bryobacteraceae bacterium]|nr:hypothetical protein [Bryobacteraceae bacterium]
MLRMQADYTPSAAFVETSSGPVLEPVFFPAIDPEVQHFLGLMVRYVAAAAREWKQAVSALDKVQNERRANPNPAAKIEVAPAPPTQHPPASEDIPRVCRAALKRAHSKAARQTHRTEQVKVSAAAGIGFVSQKRTAKV